MTSRGKRYWSSGAIPVIEPERLGRIIAASSDIAIVVNEIGGVLSVMTNPHNAGLDALEHWEGRDIREVLATESVTKLNARLEALVRGEADERPVELNHVEPADWEFPVRYTFHALGTDGVVLMLGRDLRPVAEVQQQLVRAQLALEQDYEEQRDAQTRFRVLLDAAREPLVFVAVDTGRITDASAAAERLLGRGGSLPGTAFAALFARGETLFAALAARAGEEGAPPLAAQVTDGPELNLRARAFRSAGDRMLVVRLEPADGPAPRDDVAPDHLAAFFAQGVDAIVFTDATGTIRSVNEAFLGLVDVDSAADVKDRQLADFLLRGGADQKVLIDNVTRAGHMRLFATRLTPAFGGEVQVEMSATFLTHAERPAIVFVIRAARRGDGARPSADGAVAGGDPGMRSVRELVGTTTLRDIVAETTEVIERMCIETAVELTQNNRVAAADMLGLSRQSLYVKLRKYGLLARNA